MKFTRQIKLNLVVNSYVYNSVSGKFSTIFNEEMNY